MCLLLLAFFSYSAFAGGETEGQPFPYMPTSELTPGSLCDRPDELRYAERISYCKRNVSSATKARIFDNYEKLGYELLRRFPREKFKIDHFVTLCAGGSNEEDNLWPQHQEVFTITDELEQTVCEKLAGGRLRQAQALDYIRRGKLDLRSVRMLLSAIKEL